MSAEHKPHSDPEVMGRFRRFLVRADAPVFVEALDGLVEQNERQATNIDALYRQRRDAELACELTREENTRLLEQLEALQRAVEHYVEADECYQRRIDTQPLKTALPNPVVTGDGTGEALDPLIEGFSAPRVSNPAMRRDKLTPKEAQDMNPPGACP